MNVAQPVTKGCAKVPIVMQMEALECGAACLAMVLAYYGRWISLEQARLDCGVSRDGSNAANVLKAARRYGLEAKPYRYEPWELKGMVSFPCIIHWNFNHFVVLCGFKGNYACLNDPAQGCVKVTMDEFSRSFTGICLQFKPTDAFVPSGNRPSMIDFARKRLSKFGSAATFVILTTIIGYLFDIINPIFSRFFMDRLLTGENRELLAPFVKIMVIFALMQIVVSALKDIFALKIHGKMDIVDSSSYMWKVPRMPMEFFSQRNAGDVLQRQGINASIAAKLVDNLMPLVLNLFVLLAYLVIMLRYSVLLTLVGVTVLVINLLLTKAILDRQINVTRVLKRNESKLVATTYSGMQMIETIKASGAENGFFQRWAGCQASTVLQAQRGQEMRLFFGGIPSLLISIANASVLILGVWLAMHGEFTIGMIMTFQGLMANFMKPVSALTSATQIIQELRTDMERVEDVLEYPSDPHVNDEPLRDDVVYQKLTGDVELKHVTFGYSHLAPPLIQDFSMHLHPGERIAFVGSSGCGKSTLAKLISGLYDPWEGEVLFDGKPLSDINRAVFTGSVTVVDQDIALFEGSVRDNVTLWNPNIEDFEVILAERDAQIYDDLLARESGPNCTIQEGGKDLSGGQRQRLEIARSLAQDPSILIMDEATSALDAKTEHELVEAVRKRGITCIIIAHRLSTIRDCDEIIVMDKGRVVERGTHDELYAAGGYYAELISND